MIDVYEILDRDSPLTLLDTNASDEVLDRLRQISMHEGRIIYRWQSDTGLYPINDPAMPMAGTDTLAAAMKVLGQQRYRSFCVIDSLAGIDFGLLQQHSWKRQVDPQSGFSLLLLLPESSLPEGLRKVLRVVHWQKPEQVMPRLRNGQWLA